MRVRTAVLPGEDPAAFRARLDAWIDELKPVDEIDLHLVTVAVETSWKLDRVQRAIEARRAALAHGDADRLAARAEAVVALGRRLFHDPAGPLCLYPHIPPLDDDARQRISWSADPADPEDPARIVVRLEATALGCAWLLERWGELRSILEAGRVWMPHDRLKATRMLGRQPLDAPDDHRVMLIHLCDDRRDEFDGRGCCDLSNELEPGERGILLGRLYHRGVWDARPSGPEAARASLLGLVDEEEQRLEEVLAIHLEREEAEAEAAAAFDTSADGERLRKYEASCDRTLLRIIETLRKRHESNDVRLERRPASSLAASALPRGSTHRPFERGGGRAVSVPAGSLASRPDPSAGIPVKPDRLDPPPALGIEPDGLAAGPRDETFDVRVPAFAELSDLDPATVAGRPGTTDPEPLASPAETGGSLADDAVPAVVGDREPSIVQDPDNPPNLDSRPATAARRLAGAILALFALIVLAGRLTSIADSTPLAPPTSSRVPADDPARVSRVRSFDSTSGGEREQRNSLRRMGDRAERPGGCAAGRGSAHPVSA